jgi:hypothetical protein
MRLTSSDTVLNQQPKPGGWEQILKADADELPNKMLTEPVATSLKHVEFLEL